MRYNTILFDADNTLLDFDRAEQEALEWVFHAFHLPFHTQTVSDYRTINNRLWQAFEQNQIEKSEIGQQRFCLLFEQLGLSQNGAEVNAAYMERLGQGCYRIDGALETCRALQELGCRLYIVTNGTAHIQYSRLAGSGLNPYLEAVFVSEEVGFQKPLKGYFDYVFAHIPRFRPADTLLVGDSLTSDIAGGKAAGLDTCWFCPGDAQSAEPTYTIRSLKQLLALVSSTI